MAAGSIVVSRRRENLFPREKGTSDHCFSGKRGVELRGDCGLGGRQEDWVLTNKRRRDDRGCGDDSLCRKRKAGELLDRNSVPRKTVVLPAQKQRKLSPKTWGGMDCKVAASSKTNLVAEIVTGVSPLEPWSKLSGKSQVPADSLSPGRIDSLNDEQELGQLDEEDFIHGPNLSKSRWACDDDVLDENPYLDENLEALNRMGKKSEMGGIGISLHQSEGSDLTSDRSSGSDEGCVSGAHRADELSGSELGTNGYVDMVLSNDEVDLESEEAAARAVESSSKTMLQASRSVSEYEKLGKISEGSYGIVYKARDKQTGEIVALKKLKMMGSDKEGIPLYYLREINSLLSFNHPSILCVKEVVVDDDDFAGFNNIFIVMEYMEHDVKGFMEARKQTYSQSEVKCLMLQLLEGVKYLHDHWVLHRDLKTSNLLLNNEGVLKIGDFGMSREYGSPLKSYTALVVTLWYRAPELLLGVKEYSTAVDMWSVGCIMAELLSSKPLFDGKTELDQIDKIFKILGTPSEKIWSGCSKFSGFKANFVRQPYNLLRKKFPLTSFTGSPVLSELGLDLLSRLLTYDPEKRITAEEAINHGWFREVPLPKSREFMPTFPSQHGQKR